MYNITFQQIETFLAVSKYLNMTRAAESLFTTQPALSKTLQRFEKSIGFEVFMRNSKGVSLTPQGEYLYRSIVALYGNLNTVIDNAAAMAHENKRTLRIALPSLFDVSEAFSPVKSLVKKFEEKYSDIQLEERLFDFVDLRKNFEIGLADLAISNEIDIANIPGVEYMRVCRYPIYMIMSARHPLAKYDILPKELLVHETVYQLTGNNSTALREETYKTCRLMGFKPKNIVLVDNFQTFMHLLLSKRGITFFERIYYKEDELKYFSLEGIVPDTYCSVAWHQDNQSEEMKRFLKFLSEERVAML